MYKLEVTLKQHTPLIHFQHDQEGATLRASEVKPKLDRFILTKLGNGDYNKGKDKAKKNGWLIGVKPEDKIEYEKHYALNYKMNFFIGKIQEEYFIATNLIEDFVNLLEARGIKTIPQSLYFAQEKQNNGIVGHWGVNEKNWKLIPQKGILCKDNVEMKIFCLLSDLRKYIGENIREFFYVENFGTRQNKGFGSFQVENITPKEIEKEQISIESALKNNFDFVYKYNYFIPEDNYLQESFKIIQNDYQLLKAGKNHGRYAKSKLFLYGISLKNPIRWEKRIIKREIYRLSQSSNDEYQKFPYTLFVRGNNSNTFGKLNTDQKWFDKKSEFDYKYLRAVLGIAEQFEFIIYDPSEKNNKSKKKYIVKLKDSSGKIERFKSPLTFKIIDKRIYLLGNELPGNLRGDFSLFISVKGDDEYSEERKIKLTEEKISIPENFSIKDFIEFAMSDKTNGENLNYTKIL